MPDDPSSAPEASPKRGISEPTGARGRLVADFFRPGRGQFVVGVALFLTALLVVLTLRSQAEQPEFSNARQADLIQLLDNVTAETRRLEDQIAELESAREELVNGADRDAAARAEAERRLTQAQILAGTTAVEGPGIEIRIQDPAGNVTADLLLDAVEELRDAGAEVIQINDQVRLVQRSHFGTDAEGRPTVDNVTLQAPFVLDVIGDPATLEAGARFRGGLVSEVEGERVGGRVTITQLDRIEIDTLVEPADNEFARPR